MQRCYKRNACTNKSITATLLLLSSSAPQSVLHSYEFCSHCSSILGSTASSPLLLILSSKRIHEIKVRSALQTNNNHSTIPNSNNHTQRQNTRWYTARDKVLHLKIADAGLRIFHHDGRYFLLIFTHQGISKKICPLLPSPEMRRDGRVVKDRQEEKI